MISTLIGFVLFFVSSTNAQTFQVTTNNGIVEGTKNFTIQQNTEFYSFRGIPYAQPPIGNLRFSAPVPISNWPGVFDATRDGNLCVQFASDGSGKTVGSEDCLVINVYTPKLPTNNSALLPVMVWVHGGIFLVGAGSFYGPDYILDENIVVVTFNYRLGIFGFLSTMDEVAPGNYGLKDQLLALKWAKDNVARFGGNPNDITLAGESAGSVSVGILAQTPAAQGLFNKIIMESGTPLCVWSMSRSARNVAFATGTVLGIITTDSATLIAGLRRRTILQLNTLSTLTQFVALIAANNPLAGLVFAPVIEPNLPGAIYYFKSQDQLLTGNFASVPYLMGSNSNEGALLDPLIQYVRLYLLTYDLLPVNLIPPSLNIASFSQRSAAIEIRRYYFGLLPVVLQPTSTIIEFISHSQFTRAIIETTNLISRRNPTYMYRFSYVGNLGLAVLGLPSRTFDGVAHTEEIAYLWIMPTEATANVTAGDRITRTRMVKIWANFIKTSNPTPIVDDLLQGVTWPLTRQVGTTDDLQYLDIGKDLVLGSAPERDDQTFWDGIFSRYGNPPYATY